MIPSQLNMGHWREVFKGSSYYYGLDGLKLTNYPWKVTYELKLGEYAPYSGDDVTDKFKDIIEPGDKAYCDMSTISWVPCGFFSSKSKGVATVIAKVYRWEVDDISTYAARTWSWMGVDWGKETSITSYQRAHESASKMEKKIMDSKEIDRAIELLQAMQQGKTIENSNGALMDNFMFGTKNCTCTEPSFCRVRKEPKYRPYTPAEAIGLIGLNVMPKSGVGDILKAMRIDSVTVRDSITTGNITGIVLRPEIQGGREVTVTPDALLKGYTRYGDGAPCGVKLED